MGEVVSGEFKPSAEQSAEKKERETSLNKIKQLGKISEEAERKIQAEMAIMFKEKQQELVPQYNHLKNCGKQLK